ncbi:class I SAM-dependent methyltransferase [Georgenia ruanii]|uniref:Methyltransferase domain-containing protein n=1 Tax=Georgenia ruanii TaxID=348442 RepID=A0A7J9UV15_9MICO|nr:class I SAM-dependent methyltransferase [Georgenia ruanii]MPV88193.1 methyltransferase domain-containing protein [Georgenia ruanii]
MADVWDAGNAYEGYMGRWSRPVAVQFVRWLGAAPGLTWLDVGCGTGALTAAIAATEPTCVTGVDSSPALVSAARSPGTDPRVRFAVADAAALPLEDGSVDRCVSGLVLNFLPDPAAAVAEMTRVTRPGGWVAAYVWDYAGGMELLREFWAAAVAVDPDADRVDERRRFPLCAPRPLAALFRSAGLGDVATSAIIVSRRFARFQELWTPFLGGQGPAPGYVGSLGPRQRTTLARAFRGRLPVSADGAISLAARAWAVRGRRPGA